MTLEQETHDFVVMFVMFWPDGRAEAGLFDFGCTQRPAHPPLAIESLLTKRRMRSVMTNLKITVWILSDDVGAVRSTIKPPNLSIAELHSRWASLSDR
jgi:hypothetical protein